MKKRIFAMNAVRNVCLGLFILALFSCDNPFKAGLGPIVDIRPPTVSLLSPEVGSYIRGTVRFSGEAEDDYKLEPVLFRITNHPHVEESEWREYAAARDIVSFGRAQVRWSVTIDTTKFPDGDFKIQVMARDTVGNTAETDEIVFIVKNNPPAIRMAFPPILEWDGIDENNQNGKLRGNHLNFGAVSSLPDFLIFDRQMVRDTFLVGLITDSEGVEIGRAHV